ncbi:hypothetical protein M885DRAFT_57209 [Pelagophyceae sp. CCMP2097]|nr:hypothetical protein M885DRAFT_57209 [Pelagophyceae sp. CCMP2097]
MSSAPDPAVPPAAAVVEAAAEAPVAVEEPAAAEPVVEAAAEAPVAVEEPAAAEPAAAEPAAAEPAAAEPAAAEPAAAEAKPVASAEPASAEPVAAAEADVVKPAEAADAAAAKGVPEEDVLKPHPLVSIVKAPSSDYVAEAKTWVLWDSGRKKGFPYNYTVEEKVLMVEGKATLQPNEGGDVVTVEAGDQVTFHVGASFEIVETNGDSRLGFQCKWTIQQRVKKHYVVEGGDDEEEEESEGITCDACKKPCYAESYFVADGELDICPKCFKTARGADRKRYAGAERQLEGEAYVEPEAPKKRAKRG